VRLFIAAYPSEEALDDLESVLSNLGMVRHASANQVNVRLTRRELWHVTLAFLGDVERVEAAAQALDSVAGSAAVLRIGGGGKFGRGRFTIVWAGLRGDVDALARTAASARAQIRRVRLQYDKKPFRPHVTIARPGDRAPAAVVAADVAALEAYDGPDWTSDEICLVSSRQGPRPVYEIIHRVKIV
jgi:RNA 2',3'-cyclic 3'-phosphodiesterase